MEELDWSITQKTRKERLDLESIVFGNNKRFKLYDSKYLNIYNKSKTTPSLVNKNGKSRIPVSTVPKTKANKRQTPTKIIKYATFKAALFAIDPNEFNELLEASQINHRNDLVLLKLASGFLNSRLKIENEEEILFFGKAINYPDNVLPRTLKETLSDMIKEASISNLQYFFDQSLSTLWEEMNKSSSGYIGLMIIIQQIAINRPEVCVNNLARFAITRNFYENHAIVCMCLFWALGSAAISNTTVALKVFQDFMYPVVNIYPKYIFEYLYKALQYDTPKLNLSMREYGNLVESILSESESAEETKHLQMIKLRSLELLTERFIDSLEEKKIVNMFLSLLEDNKSQKSIKGLAHCLLRNIACLKVWNLNLENYIPETILIFNYLFDHNEFEKLNQDPLFIQFVKNIDFLKYPSLKYIKDLQSKVPADNKNKKKSGGASKNASSSSSSVFPYLFGSFLLFGAITGLIAYDTHKNDGKFEQSTVGRLLQQAGALPHVQNAWFVSMKYSARGYQWAEERAPVVYSKTTKVLAPYGEFAKDFALTAVNGAKKGWENTKLYVEKQTPVVIEFTDKYAPGVGKKVQDFTVKTCKTLCGLTCSAYKNSVDFFKAKVFVGKFSPENLGKALNQTQVRAGEYYSWFHEKVELYAKLK